jgi:pectinesterase
MTRMSHLLAAIAAIVVLAALSPVARHPAGPAAAVTAVNPIDVARPAETIVLAGADLQQALATDDIRKVHVAEEPGGKEVQAQAVDLNDDGKFDELVFQADFGPRQQKTFGLTVGDRHVYTRDQFKAYGRFVRERRDDFAWENDRIAHRMYGAALETWAQEPLTSSGVDVWVKRTRRLVINDWYMVDDYHRDTGEGADLYSVGRSRGCGGSGIWADGKLSVSKNFRNSRSLANGPIRVMFELEYDAWQAGTTVVSEVKRITLDAGQNLDRFESFYKVTPAAAVQHAAGIKKAAGAQVAFNRETGVLRTWEPVKEAGSLGCGIVMDPAAIAGAPEADGNVLLTTTVPAGRPVVYYAGFGWDRSGDFTGLADWDRYLEQFSRRLRAPVKVAVSAR